MADFRGTILTYYGRNLLIKALSGATIKFTKVQIGDGIWDDSVNPEKLESLISPRIELPIQDIEVVGDGTARIRFILTNTNLKEGFFTREIGIFAEDPDEGEILYAVTYTDNPDFIPADGPTKVESITDVYTVISNAQNVTAVIADSLILATLEDIEKHNSSNTAHQDIRDNISQVLNTLKNHEADDNAHNIPSQISSAIDVHNQSNSAHQQLFTAHNMDSNAHPDIRNAIKEAISQTQNLFLLDKKLFGGL